MAEAAVPACVADFDSSECTGDAAACNDREDDVSLSNAYSSMSSVDSSLQDPETQDIYKFLEGSYHFCILMNFQIGFFFFVYLCIYFVMPCLLSLLKFVTN